MQKTNVMAYRNDVILCDETLMLNSQIKILCKKNLKANLFTVIARLSSNYLNLDRSIIIIIVMTLNKAFL